MHWGAWSPGLGPKPRGFAEEWVPTHLRELARPELAGRPYAKVARS